MQRDGKPPRQRNLGLSCATAPSEAERPGLEPVVGAATVAAGLTFWLTTSPGRADPDDARQVALGETIYRQHCASCHGANLEGQPEWWVRKPDGRLPAPPHDESGHTWHHPDEHLFQITKQCHVPPLAPEGYATDMLAFAPTLTDEEIWVALAFIKSRWPANIRARQSGLNKRVSR